MPHIIELIFMGVLLFGMFTILTLVMPVAVIVLIWRSNQSVTRELLLTAIQAALVFGAYIAFLPLVQ